MLTARYPPFSSSRSSPSLRASGSWLPQDQARPRQTAAEAGPAVKRTRGTPADDADVTARFTGVQPAQPRGCLLRRDRPARSRTTTKEEIE